MKLELVEREKDGAIFYAAIASPSGLIAYGDTKEQAVERLKKMFAFWVDTRFNLMSEQSEDKNEK